MIGKTNLKWAPGTAYSYSSLGYILLGHIAEKVSGKSFSRLMQERICEPLGLRDTGFAYNEALVKRLALPYDYALYKNHQDQLRVGYRNSEYREQSNSYCTGGIYSSVRDLFKWSRAVLGHQLLNETLTSKMLSRQSGSYGYGWQIPDPSRWDLDVHLLEHGGSTTGYRSLIAILGRGAYTLIALGNTDKSSSSQLVSAFARAIYQRDPMPYQHLGTVLAWTLIEHGEAAAKQKLEKFAAQAFKGYQKGDYPFHSFAQEILDHGDAQKALFLTHLGLGLFPESGLLHLNLGAIAQEQKRKEDAVAAFTKAEELGNAGIQKVARAKLEELAKP